MRRLVWLVHVVLGCPDRMLVVDPELGDALVCLGCDRRVKP